MAVLIIEHGPGRDDAPGAGAAGEADALAGALAAVQEPGRGDEVHTRDELAGLLVGHEDGVPAQGGDGVGAAGAAEAPVLALVVAQGGGVDVAVGVYLERVEDAVVHEADLGVEAHGVHRAPLEGAIAGAAGDHRHERVEREGGLGGDDAVFSDVDGVGRVQLLAQEDGGHGGAAAGHPVRPGVLHHAGHHADLVLALVEVGSLLAHAVYPSLMVARPWISFSRLAPTSLSSISAWEETPYTYFSKYWGMRPRRVEATISMTCGTSEA